MISYHCTIDCPGTPIDDMTVDIHQNSVLKDTWFKAIGELSGDETPKETQWYKEVLSKRLRVSQ